MHENYGRRANCRICRSKALTEVLSLGQMAISNFDGSSPEYAPLTLGVCETSQGGCGFLQLLYAGVEREKLYSRYWYRSGINEAMRAALGEIAADVGRKVKLCQRDIVVDIGSNDSTLLRSYDETGVRRIGFEPAANVIQSIDDVNTTIVNDYFSRSQFLLHAGPEAKAKVVTSIAMFYDLENPHKETGDIDLILAEDGLWVVQMSYLPEMLLTNNFDNICHEHVGYYSLTSFMNLLEPHDLVVRDVTFNPVNGGSFRVYVQHRSQRSAPWPDQHADLRVTSVLEREEEMGLHGVDVYQRFAKRVDSIRTSVRTFVQEQISDGKEIHVYGASTKGNTLLQHFGLDGSHIRFAADRNPEKWGSTTVATGIPIVSEAESRQRRPDYYLVLPWHFRDGFLERELKYLDEGGAMLFPLPQPTLVRRVEGEFVESILMAT